MAVIYKISCLDESIKESYVGSSMDFKERMSKHKYSCNNENYRYYNFPLYKFIRENGGWGAWKMTIIDSLTTIDKTEKEKCERKYIEENRDIALNKIWRDANYFTSRSMDVYIAKLRKYLDKDVSLKIINVHGEGFRLMKE